MRGILLLTALLAVQASAKESKSDAALRQQLERSPASLESLVKVKGDSLDPSYTISTSGVSVFVSKGWLASTTIENSFLRAFVDKKTGAVTAQVYHSARYGGNGWNHFRRASYEGADGLVETSADRVGSDVSCARYGCTYYEDIVFDVPWSTFEALASKYDPANPMTGMKYRLFGQSGNNFDEGIPINEIVAFVNVVKKIRNPAPQAIILPPEQQPKP